MYLISLFMLTLSDKEDGFFVQTTVFLKSFGVGNTLKGGGTVEPSSK